MNPILDFKPIVIDLKDLGRVIVRHPDGSLTGLPDDERAIAQIMKCGEEQYLTYDTSLDALAALVRLTERGNEFQEMIVFRCPDCNLWHWDNDRSYVVR